MRRMSLTVLATAILLTFSTLSVQAQNEKVDNSTVIELLKSNFGTEEIKGYLENASERDFHLDITSLKALKDAGADKDLIVYLQSVAKKDFGYDGIYWWNVSAGSKPKHLMYSALEQESKGMNGGFLGAVTAIGGTALGIHKGSAAPILGGAAVGTLLASGNFKAEKLALPGNVAKTAIHTDDGSIPVFRFYLPKRTIQDGLTASDLWYNQWMASISSPNEFQCIKLTVKKNKRTLPTGMSWGVAGFQSKNAGKKDIINFAIREINNTTFEVSFPEGIEPGEYCFFFKDIKNEWFQKNAVAYDFSVE